VEIVFKDAIFGSGHATCGVLVSGKSGPALAVRSTGWSADRLTSVPAGRLSVGYLLIIMMMQRTRKHCGNPERISFRLAVMTYQSIHGTSPSYLQSCFTRVADDSCGLLPHVVYVRSARSSLYSRQAGVSGFWCHRLERHASPRRICAVALGFQDISVFRSYQDTIIW